MRYLLVALCVLLQLNLSSSGLLEQIKDLFKSNSPDDDFLNNIRFRCFRNSSLDNYINIGYATARNSIPSKCLPEDVANKSIIFFFDGFKENSTDPDQLIEVDLYQAMLEQPDVVFIPLRYGDLVSTGGCEKAPGLSQIPCFAKSYLRAVNNGIMIGKKVAEIFISWMESNSVPIENIRLLGFSLGVDIMFSTIDKVFKDTGMKLERATGIEPAGPFSWLPNEYTHQHHVKYLDIMHGNPGLLGSPLKMGSVDFFINYLKVVQPGCGGIKNLASLALNPTKLKCSHDRTMELYIDSIKNPKSYPACCTMMYPLPFCVVEKPPVYMGFGLEPNTHGACFLKTNAEPSYSEGMAGAKPPWGKKKP